MPKISDCLDRLAEATGTEIERRGRGVYITGPSDSMKELFDGLSFTSMSAFCMIARIAMANGMTAANVLATSGYKIPLDRNGSLSAPKRTTATDEATLARILRESGG